MILLLKAVRSMWGNKSAYLACIVLIAVGILVYIAMGIAAEQLAVSRDRYYQEYRMADIFAKVQAIPQSAAATLAGIPGIADVSLRMTEDTRVDIAGNDKIMTLRLISYDPADEDPINGVLFTGAGFQNPTDIMPAEGFLTAHGFSVGDTVPLIVNGARKTFTLCGTAASPEYVFIIKDLNEMLPDPETFSVAYMAAEQMAAQLNRTACNDVAFALAQGYTYDDVKSALEDALQQYGLLELTPRKDQISHTMLDSEITSTQSMTTTIPFVFVFMAVVVLYLMLKRVIEQDRTQIGTMKAFGYSNAAVVAHYLVYGLITGAVGGGLGAVSGYCLSGSISALYNEFYKLPAVAENGSAVRLIVTGVLIALCGGLFGAFMGAKSVVKLIPSDAMRPAAPPAAKQDPLKYMPFLRYILHTGGNMAIRNLLRNKMRSAFIVLGILFSYGMLAFMGSYWSMIDDMMMNQFTKIQLYDIKIGFDQPVSTAAGLESVYDISGVSIAEGLLEIPMALSNAHRSESVVVTGLSDGSLLYKIYDNDRDRTVAPPQNGLILSDALAADLEVSAGDIITVSSPWLADDTTLAVSGVVRQSLGTSAFMERDALAAVCHTGDRITSAVVRTSDTAFAKEFLKEAKNVRLIEDKSRTLATYRAFLANYDAMIYILVVVAIIVAFAIIYNTSTISLSERKREFATLRVLGMHTREVGAILAFEYWILCVFGIAAGVPFTVFLKETLAKSIETEAFTFPTDTPFTAYALAALGCMAAVLISNRSATKNIRAFDLVEVLKERE